MGDSHSSEDGQQDRATGERQKDTSRAGHDLTAAILDTIASLVVVLDREGRIVRFSCACENTTGYSSAEVEGRVFWDALSLPEEAESVMAVYTELRARQFPNEHEDDWLTKEGRRRWIAWSNNAVVDEDGQVEYVIGTGTDVTERKRTDEAVLRAKQDWERTFDAVPVPIAIIDH